MGGLGPEVPGDGGHHAIGGGVAIGFDHTEHATGLVVPGRQFQLPVGDPRPLSILKELVMRLDERIGVDERPTPDSRAGEHHHLAQ